MYFEHYGLERNPFSLTPDTRCFLALPPHEEAMQVLRTAILAGEGVIKVTGEVGTGKTLLCRKLLNELPQAEIVLAYIPNPDLQPNELRAALASELGVTTDLNDTLAQTQQIQQRLIQLAEQNKQVVLLLDEAQALPDASLEALRLFTNLETETRKLLQLVLFGQPELDHRLAQSHLRQLRQRICFSYQLRPIRRFEIGSYVQHRMTSCGYRGAPVLSQSQCRLLSWASQGVPRLINLICHKALMLSYGRGTHRVTWWALWRAIRDTEGARGHKLSTAA